MPVITPDGGSITRVGNSYRAAYTSVDHAVDWQTEWFDFPGYSMNILITRLAFPGGSDNRLYQAQCRCVIEGMSPGASPEFLVSGRLVKNDGYVEWNNFQMPVVGYYKPAWSTTMTADACFMCPSATRLVWAAATDSTPGFANIIITYMPMNGV